VADEESAAAPVGRITPGETDVKLHHESQADPPDLQRTAARTRAINVCGRGLGKQQPTLYQHIGSFGHDDSVERIPRPHEHSRHWLQFTQLHALDTLHQLQKGIHGLAPRKTPCHLRNVFT